MTGAPARPRREGRPEPKAGDPSTGPERARAVCPACLHPARTCVCAAVRPFSPGFDLVILMHPKELRNQSTGTGRLAHLCVAGSEVLTGVDFSGHPRVNSILADPSRFPVVLFPGAAPLAPAALADAVRASGRRLTVFVLDGTWIAARKMMKLSGNLAGLPRASLAAAGPSRFALKRQPHPWCLSTIEAVHALIDALDGAGLVRTGGRHGNLMDVLDAMVEAQSRIAREAAGRGRRAAPGDAAPPRPVSAKNRRRVGFTH